MRAGIYCVRVVEVLRERGTGSRRLRSLPRASCCVVFGGVMSTGPGFCVPARVTAVIAPACLLSPSSACPSPAGKCSSCTGTKARQRNVCLCLYVQALRLPQIPGDWDASEDVQCRARSSLLAPFDIHVHCKVIILPSHRDLHTVRGSG